MKIIIIRNKHIIVPKKKKSTEKMEILVLAWVSASGSHADNLTETGIQSDGANDW